MISKMVFCQLYIFQRWKFLKDQKMTFKELKDEFKQTEGDPLIKSMRRQKQQQVAYGQMMSQVKEAENQVDGSLLYSGLASKTVKGSDEFVEGVDVWNNKANQTLEQMLRKLWDGIASGVSNCGYSSVSGFIGNGVFEVKAR